MKGIVFNIKKFAIHDGPGIRTTVFLKGCPLNCLWCHNPESKGKVCFNPDNRKEKEYSCSSLLKEIEKDRVFYEESSGGVTFSGGEPTLQHDFLLEMLKKCKNNEIHTVVDTTGYCKKEILEKISEFTDMFLFDLKLMENDEHKKYTNVENKIILSNLKYLDSLNKKLKIRIPLVKNITDTEKNINAILDFIKQLKNVVEVNLLKYHKLGISKLSGKELEKVENLEPPTDERMNEIYNLFKINNFNVKIGG